MVEAYSHECSSCGFWPGDEKSEPSFYAYAYPEPPGFGKASIRPADAAYNSQMGEFMLPYDAMRKTRSPDGALMDFLQSTYDAAADLGRWSREQLERQGASHGIA